MKSHVKVSAKRLLLIVQLPLLLYLIRSLVTRKG